MKKHIRFILAVCLTLCMVICLGAAVACDTNNGGKDTFTIIVKYENGTPAANNWVQACSDGATGGQCLSSYTDSNGKSVYDISVAPWIESESLHAQVRVNEGYSVYDEEGNLYNVDSSLPGISATYGTYVDHHKVKSVTFIIKAEPEPTEPTPILVGNEYEDDFRGGETKAYSTFVFASAAIFEADTQGAEFDLTVMVNSTVVKTEVLDSTNTSVELNLGAAGANGTDVNVTLTPKTKSAVSITFALCPVHQLGDTINARETKVYRSYIELSNENTDLTFTNPNPEAVLSGFPVTVKLGTQSVTWSSESAISSIPTTQTGRVSLSFEFATADSANLYLTVTDANAVSDDEVTLDQPIVVELTSMWDSLELTFVATEADTYVITVESSQHAQINYSITNKYVYSDAYCASQNGNKLVIVVDLEAGDTLTITFGLEMSEDFVDYGDTYTAVLSKKTGDVTPSNPME